MRQRNSTLAATAIAVFTLLIGAAMAQNQIAVFPQIANGGGFFTDLTFTNQGYGPSQGVSIRFFDNDGDPLFLTINGIAQASVVQFILPAGATNTIRTSLDSETAIPGYAMVDFPPAASVRGTAVIRSVMNGQTETQVGVSMQFADTSYTFAAEVDTANGVNTGIALANGDFQDDFSPQPRPQEFIVTLIGVGGQIVDQTLVSLGESEHLSFFLDEPQIFPGLNFFEGSVSVSAGLQFGVLPLRLEGRSLSSLAIDRGPVLAAFDNSAQVNDINEAENNDTPQSAQPLAIPAEVVGGIDIVADTDLFQVNLLQGDILTAFVVADNALDSFLTLETPGGDLVAFNDQNGLLFRNDSFIRMVIPVTGTYIIRVEDFFFDGGPDFGYRLLVRVE